MKQYKYKIVMTIFCVLFKLTVLGNNSLNLDGFPEE